MKLVGVEDLTGRSYPALLGGERERPYLARVLTQIRAGPQFESRYLLLEDPASGLDLADTQLELQTARKFSKSDTVVMTVSDDQNFVAQDAPKTLVSANRKRDAYGRHEEIMTRVIFNDVFDSGVYVTKDVKNFEIRSSVSNPNILLRKERFV